MLSVCLCLSVVVFVRLSAYLVGFGVVESCCFFVFFLGGGGGCMLESAGFIRGRWRW